MAGLQYGLPPGFDRAKAIIKWNMVKGGRITKDLPLEIRSNVHGDEEVYNAFAFSMMITNQPQLIGVDGHYDSNNVSLGA